MSQQEVSFPHETGAQITTLPQAFQQTVTLRPDAVALRTVGGIQQITWREFAERVEKIAAGLAALGLRRGDTLAIMLTNRPEFHLVDTAALHVGAAPFSIYNTSAPEQIAYLFGNAENKIVVTEQVFLPRIQQSGVPLEHIVVVDGPATGAITLADVEANPAADFDFAATWQAVEPTDLATLIYTSGTTGPPKGVELTHRNIIAEVAALKPIAGLTFDDRIASYLPSAHIADRATALYANMVTGVQVTTVADPREIAAALPDARPTIFLGVPRVWQKIKAGIEAKLAEESSPVKRKLAGWAVGTGLASAKAQIAGKPGGGFAHRLADKLVLGKVRAALGLDEVRFAISGAAAIPVETLEFYLGLGIKVEEVWGLSETTGGTTLTRPGTLTPGSVGKAVDGIELKLADDGELLVRGPQVMRGYRKQPEKTAESIDADGWFATGDIATIDAEGNVKIVDRKKELIINEGGKNMSPTNIENAVKASSALISQVVTIGDAKPYNTAILSLDPDMAAARAKALGTPDADLATLAARDEIRTEIADAVRAANAKLSQVEQVKRFVVSGELWEPGGVELTPTMKLRRKPIAEKYADTIADLYSATPSSAVIDLGKK